jgi:hypothetical protein
MRRREECDEGMNYEENGDKEIGCKGKEGRSKMKG